jgi:hypothetical protein
VKVLYVRNLTQDCSEEKLKESFEAFGKVERVKKIKDYAFIHFEDRDNAMTVCILRTVVYFSHCPYMFLKGNFCLLNTMLYIYLSENVYTFNSFNFNCPALKNRRLLS